MRWLDFGGEPLATDIAVTPRLARPALRLGVAAPAVPVLFFCRAAGLFVLYRLR